MADHYAKTLDLLHEVADIRDALTAEYAKGARQRPALIADLHHRLGLSMKLADIHASLSVRQELQEVVAALHPGVGVRL